MKQKEVKDLIFGKYNIKLVLEIVKDSKWQEYRKSLKSMTTKDKVKMLRVWIDICKESFESKVQVTNYIYALKRGGLIK